MTSASDICPIRLAGLESLRLDPNNERDAQIISYIRALENEVIHGTRRLSNELADIRRKQLETERDRCRLEQKANDLLRSTESMRGYYERSLKKERSPVRSRVIKKLRIVKRARTD